MRSIVRSKRGMEKIWKDMGEALGKVPAISVTIVEWNPRTPQQNKKVHAMLTDLAKFTGDPDIKTWVKSLDFWPTIYKEHAGKGSVVPKSEADLTKAESSDVIEHLYMIGASLAEHGFEWSEAA